MPRSLHLLDVEYLGCGPWIGVHDLALIMRHYRLVVGVGEHDHLVGAVSTRVWKRIVFDAPTEIRLLPAGGGPDAADRRLIDEAEVIDLTRYDRLVIGSGDHIFGSVLDRASDLGVATAVAGYGFNTSRVLRHLADDVLDLSLTLAA